MGSLGVMELSIILIIVVVLFGAGRLAGIGKGLGKGIKNFKEEIDPKKEIADAKKVENEDEEKIKEVKEV